MYSRLSRLMALFAILICLPLQGLAAVTMPFYMAHQQTMEMNAAAGDMADMSHCGHRHDGNPQPKKAPCDKCLVCYLSAAQALVPFVMPVDAPDGALLVTGQTRGIPEPIPASLFHPPRPIPARC